MSKSQPHYTVSKNDTDVAHYNFNTRQLILVILAEMLLREHYLCQKLPKSVDVRCSYSVQHQCSFWDTVMYIYILTSDGYSMI